jgi:hypothetical protein
MENLERNLMVPNTEEKSHKSRCTECPAYNGCMGIWLDYFTGKGFPKLDPILVNFIAFC